MVISEFAFRVHLDVFSVWHFWLPGGMFTRENEKNMFDPRMPRASDSLQAAPRFWQYRWIDDTELCVDNFSKKLYERLSMCMTYASTCPATRMRHLARLPDWYWETNYAEIVCFRRDFPAMCARHSCEQVGRAYLVASQLERYSQVNSTRKKFSSKLPMYLP